MHIFKQRFKNELAYSSQSNICFASIKYLVNTISVHANDAILSVYDDVFFLVEKSCYLRQESQGTNASNESCFVHPLIASVKDKDNSTC